MLHGCLSHHVLKLYGIMLSDYPIFTWRPLESALVIQQICAFVLLLQSISFPSLFLLRSEEGEGGKKAYLENAFIYQSNLSRKPSRIRADWKVRLTSYESQVKFHIELTDKSCIFFIVVMFYGGKCKEVQAILKSLVTVFHRKVAGKRTLWQSEWPSFITCSVIKAG